MSDFISKKLFTEDDIREFIASHAGEIRGLYYDSHYKMGGWNGLMSALNEVEERYGVEICLEDDENEICDNHTFEQILEEELNS